MLQLYLCKPAPCVLWRCTAPLHRLIQIFGHGVQQADQPEYRGWRNISPIHGRHVQSQKSLFRNITLLTGYTRTYGFSIRHTLFLLVCMWFRFGPLLTNNKAKGWTVPSCWQCWKGYQRHHAFMLCHARVWIGTPTVQLVSCSNAAVQFPD